MESVSDRMSYIIPRGHWCEIIVLNLHAPKQDKTDRKNRFYEELEQVALHKIKILWQVIEIDQIRIVHVWSIRVNKSQIW
jgi:hypothetical protein